MNCTDCGNDIVIVKKAKLRYDGIRVKNVYLRNCEVEVCRHCGAETPVVRRIKKVHLMIALGIALQPAKLTGVELRFLRQATRMTIAEWAARIGIAPESFSRWENGRSPSQQVEKLARVDFLVRMSGEFPPDFDVLDGIAETIPAELSEQRDFALVIDAEDVEKRPQYESLRSPEFALPSSSSIDALTLDLTRSVTVKLTHAFRTPAPMAVTDIYDGELCNARSTFEIAA